MDNNEIINIDALYKYPILDECRIEELLLEEIKKNNDKIIVLDDDPTGIQTVHNVSVYTDWSNESIENGFKEKNKMFFILTNSRSFTEDKTIKVHREIGKRIEEISKRLNISYFIISRADSTLRGHYPLETSTLRNEIEKNKKNKIDGEILCPFFKEGGRYTIDNVHYVKYNDNLIPVGDTEFAKDKTFGYSSSNLLDFIEEKTDANYKKQDIITISLEELRNLEIDKITEKLKGVVNFNKVIVNAIDEIDIKVFCIALYGALKTGKRFIYRTAAAFVKVVSGISDKPLLEKPEMIPDSCNSKRGGLIIIGSHTEKTTRQLNNLKELSELKYIEFDSDLVLDENLLNKEIARVVELEEEYIKKGYSVVVYTRRRLLSLPGDTKEKALMRSVKISEAVQSLVGKLKTSPSFIIAKGGITSSDIGTKALGVRKAIVLGQIQAGIPVWQTDEESKFPLIPYIIFPGNVGEDSTLKDAIEVLIK